jgi:hypothetical protein
VYLLLQTYRVFFIDLLVETVIGTSLTSFSHPCVPPKVPYRVPCRCGQLFSRLGHTLSFTSRLYAAFREMARKCHIKGSMITAVWTHLQIFSKFKISPFGILILNSLLHSVLGGVGGFRLHLYFYFVMSSLCYERRLTMLIVALTCLVFLYKFMEKILTCFKSEHISKNRYIFVHDYWHCVLS